jgi:UDP-N-acetylglucosamine 2-epimerase
VSIVGARPQFIKIAPVCRAIQAYNEQSSGGHIRHRIIHTGQHYDHEIAELLFMQMQIPRPNHNLGVGSGTHGTQLARMIHRLERVLDPEQTDWVIIYGDTTTTLAGALVAARLNIPIAHVEAGCRSSDMTMPEEQGRIVADHLSQLLLAPSGSAVQNLCREGIGSANDPLHRRVAMVGDLMYDALLQNSEFAERRVDENLRQFELERGNYYLLTLHRAENTNHPDHLRSILDAVGSLDLPVLFPVHPRTKQILAKANISTNGMIRPVGPLGYLEMIAMEKYARKILTDSGGVQKEAFYLGVPCVTLRRTTEWPETVQLGANRIVGADREAIHAAVRENGHQEWRTSSAYGDGKSSIKIVNELLGPERVAG